jgi:hypothetical protein
MSPPAIMTIGSVFNQATPANPVAGTSAASGGGGSSNTLSMNLGGVSVNYDLGPSTETVANQAYSFLNNSFNTDTAFVGGAISGGQNFLNGIIQPVIGMAQDQQAFNTQQLPSMFTQLNSQNFSLGSAAISTEGQVASAEIAQANATARSASSGGGFCYITTAVCSTLGLPDDCYTLRMLRRFRDTYMQATEIRRDFIARYYRTAPALIEKMRALPDGSSYIARLYERFILPCCLALDQERPDRAFKLYRQMLYAVDAEVN